MNKHKNRCTTWWNHCPRRWTIVKFTIFESSCYSNSFSLLFFYIPSSFFHYGGSFTLYSFLLGHLDRTLIHHLNLYLSICLVKRLLWLSVNGGGWDYTVQGSSPHKCGQKSCCSAFNAVVAAFPLDISVFLSSSYVLKVYLHCWKLLEGHLSHLGTCLIDIRPIR